MTMLCGDELNYRDWRFVEPPAYSQDRPYWIKMVWMNGYPKLLRAYPKNPAYNSLANR